MEMLLGHLFKLYICSSCLACVLLEATLSEPWIKDVAVARKLVQALKACHLGQECCLI